MTKVTILGAETQEKKELKPIEFIYSIGADLKKSRPSNNPNQWANITLICKSYSKDGLDLMYAYDSDGRGCAYFGLFNDGIV